MTKNSQSMKSATFWRCKTQMRGYQSHLSVAKVQQAHGFAATAYYILWPQGFLG
jgi:hypothetical protein